MSEKPTAEEIMRNIGSVVNTDTGGVSADAPAPHLPLLVIAGPWPNPNIGSRQCRCFICRTFLGISPVGWAAHVENPALRPIVCADCFNLVLQISRTLTPDDIRRYAEEADDGKTRAH